jgi:CheY-like chemotaxis protein
VLVVDDHPAHRAYAKCVFEALHCKVTTADDGLEAIELASRFAFDVIIMDREMPRCGGDAATARIRAAGPSRDAMILCHTSDPPPERTRGLYDHVVDKPATVEDLAAILPMAQAPQPLRIDLPAFRRSLRR